ncbi:MAG: M20 family peptidase [Burkholderiaceae bacterium]|nr:MAG: M20 family peptidase [Burkholderiaceae bacterium]
MSKIVLIVTRGFFVAVAVAIALALLVYGQATRAPSHQLIPNAPERPLFDQSRVLKNLGDAIQLKTISSVDNPDLSADQFIKLHQLLKDRFPHLHRISQVEVIGKFSLLFHIAGSDPKANPIMLLAHQDVVPLATGTEHEWTYPPFSGAEKDGYVWGRGAWDNKGNLMSQLEAMEILLQGGFRPERGIYFALGEDEETLGLRGAGQIATTLKQRGVRLHSVLDEGLLITHGMLPGLARPGALIGVAEKGYLSVEVTVKADAGHSSMPPSPGQSAIAKLGKVITYLDQHPRPSQIDGVARQLFETLAPEMHGLNHYALSNLWLFGPIVREQLEQSRASRALLQTSTAFTMSNAGNKENILPAQAQMTINYRLLPGDKIEVVLSDLEKAIKTQLSAEEFSIRTLPHAVNASKISPVASSQYRVLQQSIHDIFPDVVVAPGLMLGATDSLKFEELSDHIFKFSPVHANNEDLNRFHGSNERIAVNNYLDMIRFYHHYLSLASKLH